MTINAPRIEMPAKEARELYRKYKEHAYYSQPIDDEVRRTYQLIAQGRVVIRALDAIKDAGLNTAGLPKLAIGRAYLRNVVFQPQRDGGGVFGKERWDNARGSRTRVEMPAGSFTFPPSVLDNVHEAIVPLIPVHLRPKRAIESYHILWEAEWTRSIPVDPMLLRRIGKADLWLVVAAWDLTPVEQAALAGRMSA